MLIVIIICFVVVDVGVVEISIACMHARIAIERQGIVLVNAQKTKHPSMKKGKKNSTHKHTITKKGNPTRMPGLKNLLLQHDLRDQVLGRPVI